jgi:hypothetical protein
MRGREIVNAMGAVQNSTDSVATGTAQCPDHADRNPNKQIEAPPPATLGVGDTIDGGQRLDLDCEDALADRLPTPATDDALSMLPIADPDNDAAKSQPSTHVDIGGTRPFGGPGHAPVTGTGAGKMGRVRPRAGLALGAPGKARRSRTRGRTRAPRGRSEES